MSQKSFTLLLICFLIPLGGVSTDIYLPSLPALTHYFAVPKSWVQLTVTVFAFGAGFMQLVAGPVSDALGRRRLFIVALLVQAFAIMGIIFSPTIGWLIGCRLVQGIGAAFVAVSARAILTDTFEGDALKKYFNIAAVAFAMGPIMAPVLGGYLQHYFGWQASFWFLLGYVLMALVVVVVFYRESAAGLHAFSIRLLWQNYRSISKNRHFLIGSVLATCLIAPSMFFNVAGPFIVQVAMKQTAVTFGHLALCIGLAWFLGSVTNQQLFYIKPHVKIWCCMSVMPIIALSMLILSLSGLFSLWLLMVPITAMVYLCGGLFSLMVAECLTMFDTMAASVNALFFSVVWVGVSAFSGVATLLQGQTLNRMAGALLVLSLVCLGLFVTFIVQLGRSQQVA